MQLIHQGVLNNYNTNFSILSLKIIYQIILYCKFSSHIISVKYLQLMIISNYLFEQLFYSIKIELFHYL